jgi:hypothetical protein
MRSSTASFTTPTASIWKANLKEKPILLYPCRLLDL